MIQKILVTGGAGYIGSHTCKALAAAGYLPVVYDNLSRGHRWAVQWGPLEEGDIHDAARLAEVFARHQPVAVLHFAAYAYVGESMDDPGLYYDNNVAGTLSLLQAMRRAGVGKIVFSSTCATYGATVAEKFDETHAQRPLSPYGFTKLVIEKMLADFHRAYGLNAVILRYFNAGGADPDGKLGEQHDPEPHVLPSLLLTAAGRRAGFEIAGTDYDTPDGSCVRDFVHVADLADAHVLALKKLERDAGCFDYNLGNGNGYSIKQLVAAAQKVTGVNFPVKHGARRPGDPALAVGSAEKACRELGWQPRHPGIETMLEGAWRWMQREPGRWMQREPGRAGE